MLETVMNHVVIADPSPSLVLAIPTAPGIDHRRPRQTVERLPKPRDPPSDGEQVMVPVGLIHCNSLWHTINRVFHPY